MQGFGAVFDWDGVIDVFDSEPPNDQRLARHLRVIASPHIGVFTRESIDLAMNLAVENLIGALRGAGDSC